MSVSKSEPVAAPIWLDRRTPPHIVTLVLLTGLSALSLNVMLPSLPSLAAWYGADYGVAALSISAYLGLTAVLQLVLGPLSDRFGRRPVLLGCFTVFLVATVGCLLAPTIEVFLAFRMAQAVIASGIALSRAIVRDMVPADQAASLIGYVTMGMSLVPMVSPMIGGWLDETFGWQSVFVLMLAFGVAVTALMALDLGETNLRPSSSFIAQFRAYPELMRSHRFWGYSLTAALASGAFFSLLGGGPWVATNLLGMSPSSLGFHFGFISVGYLIGNFLSGRYATRVGLNGMMLYGAIVSTFGMLLVLVLFALGIRTPLSFFGSILFLGARQRPAAAERQRRHRVGAAAPRRLGLGARRRADDRRRRDAVGGRGRAAQAGDRRVAADLDHARSARSSASRRRSG